MIVDLHSSNKKYNIIYADPPWTYPKTGGTKSSRGMAKQHYNTMTTKEIAELPIANITDDNCALFMWATFPQVEQALSVIKAWGFEYYGAAFVWVKYNNKTAKYSFGMGHWTRANPEPCLLAFKGKMTPLCHNISQLVLAPKENHSKKPIEVAEKIVNLCGDLPRIELFARNQMDGWDCWGNEVE